MGTYVRTSEQPLREVIVRWREGDVTFVQLDCEHTEPATGKDKYRHIRCTQCAPVRHAAAAKQLQQPMDGPPTGRTWDYQLQQVTSRDLQAGGIWIGVLACGHTEVITGRELEDFIECEQCPPNRRADGPPVPRPNPEDLEV